MPDITITMKNNSKEIIEATHAAIAKALETVGLVAEAYAIEEETLVDTGNLRNSITHGVDGDTVYIGTNVEYAPYIEYGTSKMAGKAFLRPAMQDHVDEYIDIIRSELENA